MEHVSRSETDAVEAVPDVHLEQLAGGESMSVQHFSIDPGATVPAHEHHHEQAGFLYRGELTFLVGEDREEEVVRAGDSYVLAGHEVHAVENCGDEPAEGVDIFSPPRPNPDWAK